MYCCRYTAADAQCLCTAVGVNWCQCTAADVLSAADVLAAFSLTRRLFWLADCHVSQGVGHLDAHLDWCGACLCVWGVCVSVCMPCRSCVSVFPGVIACMCFQV